MTLYFRIFIDAATLKGKHARVREGRMIYFRIFIDAATLKHSTSGELGRSSKRDFRIFIDAATLKQPWVVRTASEAPIFPHLYRCGHIEAR